MESSVPGCPVPCQPSHEGQSGSSLPASNPCSQHAAPPLWLLEALSCVLAPETALLLASPSQLVPAVYLHASSWILKAPASPEVEGFLAGLAWAEGTHREEALNVLSDESNGATHPLRCRDFRPLHGDPGTSLVDTTVIGQYLPLPPASPTV